MVELGLYAIVRIYWTIFSGTLAIGAVDLRPILIGTGVLTALVGAAMCFSQRHLKRLLAFSTVSHVGVFLCGFGLFTGVGLAGAAAYVLAHAFAKAALFMGVGILLHRYAEVDELKLRGRGRGAGASLAVVGAAFAACGLVIAGTPMLGVFFGKSLIEDAAVDGGYGWVAWICVVSSAVTGGAILRAAGTIWGGWGENEPPESEQPQEIDEDFETLPSHDRTPPMMLVPMLAFAAAAVVIGLVPGVIDGVQRAAGRLLDRASYAADVLHGASASFSSIEPSGLHPSDFVYAGISVAAALALAALALFGSPIAERVPSRLRAAGAAGREGLRELHSGHIGDYVAWLIAGAALFGGLVALAVG
jgi:multicomponent Na+:H+ antiporter subunit D